MNRLFSLLIRTLSVALLIYFFVGISKGIYENKKDIKILKAESEEQINVNKKLSEVKTSMLKRVDNLKDPYEIEKIAREILNMKKPEEVIFRVIKEDNK